MEKSINLCSPFESLLLLVVSSLLLLRYPVILMCDDYILFIDEAIQNDEIKK